MIAKIKGKIAFFRDNYVVVDVAGVGYKIFVHDFAMGKIAGKEEIELYTHTYVREDTLALYGFLTLEELEMFELLISISGIGPKAGDWNSVHRRTENDPGGGDFRRLVDTHASFGSGQENS